MKRALIWRVYIPYSSTPIIMVQCHPTKDCYVMLVFWFIQAEEMDVLRYHANNLGQRRWIFLSCTPGTLHFRNVVYYGCWSRSQSRLLHHRPRLNEASQWLWECIQTWYCSPSISESWLPSCFIALGIICLTQPEVAQTVTCLKNK